MNTRIVVFFAALVAFVAAAYLALKPADVLDGAHGDALAAPAQEAVAPSRAFAQAHPIAPRASAARVAAAPVHLSLFNEYRQAKAYRALYDRLRSSPEGGTAEGLYVTYDILHKCATVIDRPYRRIAAVKPIEQRREEFLAALPPNDPQRDKRIAAFESEAVNRCAGFEGLAITQADLGKLLTDAASAGDPKAQAVSVEQEIWQARRAGQWRTATLSDTQISTLEQAIGTKDPEAMVVAGRLLSNTWNELTVRIGPDAQAVDPRAFYNAWQVLACQYGYPCGADNQRLLDECAYNGHCEATTLPDYLYYYASSPHESELVAQYQSVLRGAIENGDWSQLTTTRGPNPAGNRSVFGHGPG